MKKLIVLMVMAFGLLYSQENPSNTSDATAGKAASDNITVNAGEFQQVKNIILALALENRSLAEKKDIPQTDFAYGLLLDSYKLKSENDYLKAVLREFTGELKAAKTLPEVKKILGKYGVK